MKRLSTFIQARQSHSASEELQMKLYKGAANRQRDDISLTLMLLEKRSLWSVWLCYEFLDCRHLRKLFPQKFKPLNRVQMKSWQWTASSVCFYIIPPIHVHKFSNSFLFQVLTTMSLWLRFSSQFSSVLHQNGRCSERYAAFSLFISFFLFSAFLFWNLLMPFISDFDNATACKSLFVLGNFLLPNTVVWKSIYPLPVFFLIFAMLKWSRSSKTF